MVKIIASDEISRNSVFNPNLKIHHGLREKKSNI